MLEFLLRNDQQYHGATFWFEYRDRFEKKVYSIDILVEESTGLWKP